jgi:hypothetical protein
MWATVLFGSAGCPILFGGLPETGIQETSAASNPCVKKDKVNHEVSQSIAHSEKNPRHVSSKNGYGSERTSHIS